VTTCWANGCERQIDDQYLMCSRHWRLVPQEVRNRVWRHFREGQDATTASQEYFEAAADAIESVARREQKPTANSFRSRAEEMTKQA